MTDLSRGEGWPCWLQEGDLEQCSNKKPQSLHPQGTCALAPDTSDITRPFLGCRAAQNSLLRALTPRQLWPGAVGAVLLSWQRWGCGSTRQVLLLGSSAALVCSSWLCWPKVCVSLWGGAAGQGLTLRTRGLNVCPVPPPPAWEAVLGSSLSDMAWMVSSLLA